MKTDRGGGANEFASIAADPVRWITNALSFEVVARHLYEALLDLQEDYMRTGGSSWSDEVKRFVTGSAQACQHLAAVAIELSCKSIFVADGRMRVEGDSLTFASREMKAHSVSQMIAMAGLTPLDERLADRLDAIAKWAGCYPSPLSQAHFNSEALRGAAELLNYARTSIASADSKLKIVLGKRLTTPKPIESET
ncbi:MAG: hypothetical protein R2862_03475 [Thermoanaerobaculia bacterium]